MQLVNMQEGRNTQEEGLKAQKYLREELAVNLPLCSRSIDATPATLLIRLVDPATTMEATSIQIAAPLGLK